MNITFGDISYTIDSDPRMRIGVVHPDLLVGRVVQVESPSTLGINEPYWALITRVENNDLLLGEVLAPTLFLGYDKGVIVPIPRNNILFALKKDV